MTAGDLQRGIRENPAQVSHKLIQVMPVGFAMGMARTVVLALAESEFGLERGLSCCSPPSWWPLAR